MPEKSTEIIADSAAESKRRSGRVLHLPDALDLHPEKSLILYNRTSGYGSQSGHNKSKLDEKATALYRAIREVTDRRLRKIESVVECSKLAEPRRGLLRASEDARKLNAIVVAHDLSRLFRPADYDRRTNPDAEPTRQEYEQLREMTGGVVLATVLPPWLTEAQRHGYLTKRTGKAGRPRKIPHDRIPLVFAALGALYRTESDVERWQNPIRNVAKEFGVGTATIHTIIREYGDSLSPDGQRTYAEAAMDSAIELGLLDENRCPPLRPLSRSDRVRLRRANFLEECGYVRRDGEPDRRYRVNREDGRRADGEAGG